MDFQPLFVLYKYQNLLIYYKLPCFRKTIFPSERGSMSLAKIPVSILLDNMKPPTNMLSN
jgi:hypothetical protein